MFCITLEPSHVKFIKNLSYDPVVLGEKNYTDDCFGDKTGENISKKNKFYGEYTFHYWLWKNYFDNLDEKKWIGFCQYRKFWSLEEIRSKELSLKKLENIILKNVPDEFDKYFNNGKLVISGDGTFTDLHFKTSLMKSALSKSNAVHRKPTFLSLQ